MKLKLKKGCDLNLIGAVEAKSLREKIAPAQIAIVPDDFYGLVPKMEVKEGDKVAVGQPIMRDKAYEDVKIVSPVSGTVKAVVRGERRKIERVEIACDSAAAPVAYDRDGIDSPEKALKLLCAAGMLARMRQRPYDIVPRPDKAPRDIFVTAIDSAPLSAGMMPMLEGKDAELKRGVQLLKVLTKGKVYVSVGSDWTFGDLPGAEMVQIEGKHPVGNVGVQIANIAPVNKGEVVWTLSAITLAKIGRLALDGTVDGTTVAAFTGSEAQKPCLIDTVEGADMADIVNGRLKAADHNVRIISGNVLTGIAVGKDGYLRFPYTQVTVIPEGDDVAEFMGWASMSPQKMSVSRAFPGFFRRKAFNPDARILGGRRAMIMSGEYDKMIPMDIMAEFLLKAIIAKDIDNMEKLGIYEVAPEDFALAEYADTSKIPLQRIVRDGLDYLRKELE